MEEIRRRGERDAAAAGDAARARQARRVGGPDQERYGGPSRGQYLSSIPTGVTSDSDGGYDDEPGSQSDSDEEYSDESGNQSDSDDGYDIRGGIDLNDVENYWPRYLLYVNGNTLTTYPRQQENGGWATYRGVKNLTYCILSYTWGRYMSRGDEPRSALRIDGVRWTVPPINPTTGFTAEGSYRYCKESREAGAALFGSMSGVSLNFSNPAHPYMTTTSTRLAIRLGSLKGLKRHTSGYIAFQLTFYKMHKIGSDKMISVARKE